MEFFEQAEAAYQVALAKQAAERRAEAQKERARIKKASDETRDALLDTFPPPKTVEPPDDRDIVESTLNLLASPAAKAQHMNEARAQRREAFLESLRPAKASRESYDALGVAHLLGREIDIDSLEEDEEYYDED